MEEMHQHAAAAMDLSFNTKDVIYLLVIVAGGLSAWFVQKMEVQKLKDKIDALDDKRKTDALTCKEEIMNASNGRKAIKKELGQDFKDKEQILHTRIDRLRDENIKSYEKLEKRLEEMEKKQDTHTATILSAINSK